MGLGNLNPGCGLCCCRCIVPPDVNFIISDMPTELAAFNGAYSASWNDLGDLGIIPATGFTPCVTSGDNWKAGLSINYTFYPYDFLTGLPGISFRRCVQLLASMTGLDGGAGYQRFYSFFLDFDPKSSDAACSDSEIISCYDAVPSTFDQGSATACAPDPSVATVDWSIP